jgi:hypothetical protein
LGKTFTFQCSAKQDSYNVSCQAFLLSRSSEEVANSVFPAFVGSNANTIQRSTSDSYRLQVGSSRVDQAHRRHAGLETCSSGTSERGRYSDLWCVVAIIYIDTTCTCSRFVFRMNNRNRTECRCPVAVHSLQSCLRAYSDLTVEATVGARSEGDPLVVEMPKGNAGL